MSSVTSVDASRPIDTIDTIVDKAQTVADSIGPALHSLPGTPSHPAGWRAALGGLLLATPAVVFAGWVGGADAVVIALFMSAVWTTLALASELGGARQPSAVARVRGLGRRATTWARLLAVVGVSGLVPLDDVRTTFPVLALSAVGSVLAVLQQARAASPQRLILVGTRSDVEAYAASIATHGSVLLVGACVVAGERSLTVDAPLLVPTVRSLDRVAELASEVGADAVVVVPGQAVDADDVRALTWDLREPSGHAQHRRPGRRGGPPPDAPALAGGRVGHRPCGAASRRREPGRQDRPGPGRRVGPAGAGVAGPADHVGSRSG